MKSSTVPEASPLVLVAEDDGEMRELIAGRLIREGMRVIEVEDGFELRDYLELCRRGGDVPEPDVLVTDLRMPGGTGPDAVFHSSFPHAAVVVISAYLDPQARAEARQAGVAAIFEKPFRLKDLVATIHRLVPG